MTSLDIDQDIAFASRTLPAVWRERVRERRSADFLWFPDRGWETWGAVDGRVRSLAAGLAGVGVGRGDRVCLSMTNSPEMLVALLALWELGAICVPLSPQLEGALLDDRIERIAPVLLIADADCGLSPATAALREQGRFVVNGGPTESAAGAVALDSLFDSETEAPTTVVEPADPALIIFTSGSTGTAKGCVLSHHYAVYYGWVFWRYMAYREDDTLYTCLPLNHVHAMFASFWPAVLAGGRLALSSRFSARRFWPEIAESEATACSAIGMMTAVLLSQDESDWERRHKVRIAHVSGDGALAMRDFERRFDLTSMTTLYGSTEVMVFPPVLGLPPTPGLIGPQPRDWDVALVDATGNRVEGPGSGELVVRPRRQLIMFDSYHGAADETVKAFGGLWYHTGDLVRRDAVGLYWFVGRLGDTIRRRGEMISSGEIERVLAEHPAVAQVAAFPRASSVSGEEICVVAVPPSGSSLTSTELLEYCDSTLPRFMRPDRVWVREEELPKNDAGKVDKARLRRDYAAEDAVDLAPS